MALEDFCTLTELKDGLTSPDRVKDLITAMQKDQDSIVNNLDESTKKWSTIARTIAATEDHNCLDLFISLNGLSFIDKFLNNAQNLENIKDNIFEESIIDFLKALERLQIDNQKLLDSGIGKTVKTLVDHGSSLISEKAKLLCDKWMIIHDNDSVPTNQEPPPGDENEVKCRDKTELVEMSSLSSPISADVDNVPESSRGDKDEEMDDKNSGIHDSGRNSMIPEEVDDSRERSCNTSETPKTPESVIPEDTPPVITASQVSEVAQESESPNIGKGIGGFDLNQEVCSEEVDDINLINPTVSVVSALKATATMELPITPLQFEGSLGWKGSASTSAFKRVPEIEKTGTHNNQKQLIEIDLNVADGNDGVPGLHSGEESSVEARERPQLDLNSIRDEAADVARPDWWQSPSRSSSSSSKQPSRNIDLNLIDQLQPQESVISIFGTKVEVKDKGFRNLPQPSGRVINPTVDFSQSFYGFPSGPTMFFATPGGAIPYMVDSRGAPVVPQVMGSSSTQPPFMGGSGGSSGGAPPFHNFDLNTGLSIGGGKRREPDGRWDFFPVNKHQQPPWR